MTKGVQTSEFWVTLSPMVAALTSSDGRNQLATIVLMGVLAVTYTVCRTVLKNKASNE